MYSSFVIHSIEFCPSLFVNTIGNQSSLKIRESGIFTICALVIPVREKTKKKNRFFVIVALICFDFFDLVFILFSVFCNRSFFSVEIGKMVSLHYYITTIFFIGISNNLN